ncbi:hypothetical protein [Salinibius halmophilus]|uniref:hypothetical protein n=1 Tax=Salinibius halmophilus TaxID=1853216 RepID=UPI000E67601D|nr:hypothetical protein [Salinibius halmophilus]
MSSVHDRINKAISQYSAALMSNTKWKIVFEQLAEHKLAFSLSYVREQHYGPEQKITNLKLGNDYVADGVLLGGPVYFKEIHCLKINRFVTYKNPLTGASFEIDRYSVSFLNTLDKLGKYPIDFSEEHIYISGYK